MRINYHNFKQLSIVLGLAMCTFGTGFAQRTTSEENVVAQMNYCIYSLTNIIDNKSMTVLEHETDQLTSNLTVENIIGLYEINDFRQDLLDALGRFQITEEERSLMRRIQSIQRDNMKWAALSNALSPTMFVSGNVGPQMAFNVLLTAARSAVEFQTMKGEQNIEELKAMWELRKEDMIVVNDSRKSALEVVFNLYNKYHLYEYDRLTEKSAQDFSRYLQEPDPAKRARLLENNRLIFSSIADYYYHLGMAYYDAGNLTNAKKYFVEYQTRYKKAPLFRYDEKSGCIALAMLATDKNLSNIQKSELVEQALHNLPNNSAAILQCAMVYLYELNKPELALRKIIAGIDDPKATDKSVLLMAAANLFPVANKYPQLKSEICDAFKKANNISLDSYVSYLFNNQKDVWVGLSNVIKLSDTSYRRWYQLWIGKYFDDNFRITLPSNILFNPGDIKIFAEHHSAEKVKIKEIGVNFATGISIEKINKVDCFKSNKNLKYFFFDALITDKLFLPKSNLDFEKIKKREWPRMSEFALSEDDIDDIIELLEDNMPKSRDVILECEYIDGNKTQLDSINGAAVYYYGEPNGYAIHHSPIQAGIYIRFVLANGNSIMYKYDDGELKPYLYTNDQSIMYSSDNAKSEYQCKTKPKEEPSWYSKAWSNIVNWFSSDSKKESKEETSSWWSSTWNSLKNIF